MKKPTKQASPVTGAFFLDYFKVIFVSLQVMWEKLLTGVTLSLLNEVSLL